ncbi:MAG: hypothetical protein P8K78_03895 [Pirellulales bacterium]|nr:hypothetical protein [Pirellulales bacterium]
MHDAIHNTTERPQKKRCRFVLWIGGIVVALLLVFLWQLFGPHPKIVISPQTTHITAPLRANGMPDYAQRLLENARKGVTPENNAAVLLWQAVWPSDLEEQHYKLICDELGIDPVPSKEDSLQRMDEMATFRRFATWLYEQRRLSVDGRAATAETIAALASLEGSPWQLEGDAGEIWFVTDTIIEEAQFRPWPNEGIAPLADWARENQRPLDLLVAASRRPRYYSPPPQILDGTDDMQMALFLPSLNWAREAARGLSIRAMWHLHEGRPDEAWEDIIALYRMARHLASGETLVHLIVGITIENIAHQASRAFLSSGDLTAEQARRAERDLASLPNWSMVNAMNRMERLLFLDTIIYLATEVPNVGDLLYGMDGNDAILTALHFTAIDWNFVLREGNRWYDRLVAAAQLPSPSARQAAFSQIDTDLDQLNQTLQRPAAVAWGVISHRRRSEIMAAVLLEYFISAIGSCQSAADRANMNLELMRVAAALSVFRTENGHYPEKLDDLVPQFIASLPIDIFSEKPPIYRPDDDRAGYVLYSVGQNGVDDGGTDVLGWIVDGEWRDEAHEPFDYDETDQVIRFPVPPVKLPDVITDDVTEDAADRATQPDLATL